MVNKITQSRIESLADRYRELARGRDNILQEIAIAEIPEMVYNSNATILRRARRTASPASSRSF